MHGLGKLAVFILLTSVALRPQAQSSASLATDEKSAAQTPAARPDSTRLEVLKWSKAPYPLQARQEGIQGRVVLKVTISVQGDVIGAELVSGDPVLAESAVNAVKKWKFKPYIRNGKAVQAVTQLPFDFSFTEKTEDIKRPRDAKAASAAPRTDQQAANAGKQAEAGATSSTGAAGAADSAAASSTASGGASSSGTSSAGASSETPRENQTSGPSGEKSSSAASGGPNVPKRVQVMQGVSEGYVLHKVTPVYPPEAKRNRIQGTVKLHALIDEQGRIADLSPVSGPKELVPAAMGAVQLWRYRPYIFNGQPVAVETTITVNFNLR